MAEVMFCNKKLKLIGEIFMMIFLLTGCVQKNEVEQQMVNRIQLVEQTIEYGDEFPDDIRDYVICSDEEWYEDAKLDLYGANRDELGTYSVYVTHGDRHYETYITIDDQTPPEVSVEEEYVAYTHTVLPIESIVQAEDPSGIKYVRILGDDNYRIYETEPGVKEYTVKVCDVHSNTIDVAVCIRFEDVKSELADTLVELETGSDDKQWIVAYAEIIQEYELAISEAETPSSLAYELIYLNDDEIPELVVGTGAWIDVHTYADGEVYQVIESWVYGAFGISGYMYLPYENVIYSTDADYAGAICYFFYGYMNERYVIENTYDYALCVCAFRDADGDYHIDEGEEETVYYYGKEEISETEFRAYQIEGDYEMICGNKTAQEMFDELKRLAK